MIGWYYKGIQDALREAFSEVPAYEEYCHLVDRHFGSGNHPGEQGTGAHFPLGMCIHFYSPECHLFESGSQDNAFAYTRDCDTPPDTV